MRLMSRALTLVAALCGVAAVGIGSANAKPVVNPPTLHGFCGSAHPCSDNGTNTPTSVNAPNFGFSAGGHSATGTVYIDILVPDNVAIPSSYTLSGTLLGASTVTASLVSSTPWTTGQLDTYLGISASPTNPIGAFLPSTKVYDPAATGFYVFKANLGNITLPSNSGASDSSLLTLNTTLAQGSYILAFINQSGKYGATANSGAIFETGRAVPEVATWGLMLVGFGAVGAVLRRRRQAPAFAAAA